MATNFKEAYQEQEGGNGIPPNNELLGILPKEL